MVRTRGGGKYNRGGGKHKRKRKRSKKPSTNANKNAKTQHHFAESAPNTTPQNKDSEENGVGAPTVTKPQDHTSSAHRENNLSISGEEQDDTGETCEPSSNVEDDRVARLQAKVQAKEYEAKAIELKHKGKDATCFDPCSVRNMHCLQRVLDRPTCVAYL